MEKEEFDKLVNELNELSENRPKTKERMKEIAKILTLYYKQVKWKKVTKTDQ